MMTLITIALRVGLTLVVLAVAAPLAGQSVEQRTIFTTPDVRQDRDVWTDPAYYRNNTVGQLRGMAIGTEPGGGSTQQAGSRVYGSVGTAKPGALDLGTPYPFKTAMEHYDAWLKEAGGGTKHTAATIPNWRGRWVGGPAGLGGGPNPASYVASLLTPSYREYFVRELKAYTEGRIWSAGAICLPGGFFAAVGAEEFIVTPEQVWTLGSSNAQNYIRWIYTDGSGHSPKEAEFVKWHGESIGFWNGDSLIIHTNQIRGWKGGVSEFTDNLETVERYRRVGDRIEGEITLYDPEVFVRPVHARVRYQLDKETRPELRPTYNTCTDTNGPSNKVYMDERGILNERIPGDPLYFDPTDPRPWRTYLAESDRRYEAYRKSQRR
jgi:hypothetical protein